ncbi:hypothetical protein B0T26DRAFT_705854 [Lasiosphaeria miniovina]|uniref:Uncharacterized protein n=1 Tax=Lasiosphaeria miniovina TaxID=1954250 RepID=A0AA40AWF6_9PEZI|nr:uncharacterized protein B0T26DRAFT_705854 [Lasiosphaeria miniovina]KAK0723234.1 hypothetical protein B0T26DRAFT_705854 [Lasiosphaeria miniovina]
MLARGVSGSLGAGRGLGVLRVWVLMFWSASIVADCGGVFSPRMLWCGRRTVGRMMGVRLGPSLGVATMAFSSRSSLDSTKGSRPLEGVEGLSNFSGDLGVEMAESRPPSIMRLRSLTEVGCRDCMRRWVEPRSKDLSGDGSAMRLVRCGTKALSRAFSVRAAWADWIAVEVPALETTVGDCGLRGSGGGARSGSELSHLL